MSGDVPGRRPAVFLDRDGILNELVTRDGRLVSPRRFEDFRLADGASDAVDRLRAAGFLVFVVSNQPDVARGWLPEGELARMHDRLRAAVTLEEIVVCPHDDGDGCGCRKPKPGMILDLAARWQVDMSRSFVVGDTWKDAESGRRASCRTILIGGREQATAADWTVGTLRDAVTVIESQLGPREQGDGGFRA